MYEKWDVGEEFLKENRNQLNDIFMYNCNQEEHLGRTNRDSGRATGKRNQEEQPGGTTRRSIPAGAIREEQSGRSNPEGAFREEQSGRGKEPGKELKRNEKELERNLKHLTECPY